MTQNVSGYLPNLLGPVVLQNNGVALTAQPTLNFKGGTITYGVDSIVFDFGSHASSGLRVANPLGTFWYTIAGAAIVADRTLSLPLLTGSDTVVCEAHPATLASKTLASPTITGTVTYQGTKKRTLAISGEAQTTTATTIVIASFTMLDETTCDFAFTASMKAVGAVAKAGAWDGKVTYYRTGGAAPALAGVAEYGTARETTAGDGVTWQRTGNVIEVLATAADADDRNWNCELVVTETLATA